MIYLKQSTGVTISLGQFVDKTDGVTPETGLSMTVYLSKNGATFAARNSATAISHSRDGYYLIPLSTTDTDTLGILEVEVTDSATHLGVNRVYMVVTANTYDSLILGTATLQGLSTLTASQVNAEVVDALNVDTYAEPGQETPPANTTLVKKIGWLYKLARNRKTQTSTTLSIYADNATTVDAKATISDNGITYDHGEIVSGP